jgi:hypothetical protein
MPGFWIGSSVSRSASFASGWRQASPKMRCPNKSWSVFPCLPIVDETPRQAGAQIVAPHRGLQQHGAPIRARVRLIEGRQHGLGEQVGE